MVVPQILFLMVALASIIQGSPFNQTTPIESDNSVPKQVDVVFQNTYATYVKNQKIVQNGCEAKDSEEIQITFQSLQESVLNVIGVVKAPSFNSVVAAKHTETVAKLIVAYSTIVKTVVTYRADEIYPDCQQKLREITLCVQQVINVYARYKISLKEAVDNEGGIDIQAFQDLHIELNFSEADVENEEAVPIEEDPQYVGESNED